MNTTIAIINEIKQETEKAILINADGDLWLPKSQVEIAKVDCINLIRIPNWLWAQHRNQLKLTTNLDNIFETTGKIPFDPKKE